MTFYTDRFIPKDSSGCARGPVILIRPAYRDDIGLLEHEKVHRWQWIRTMGLHSFLYMLSKKYKLSVEVEAYRKQLEYPHAHSVEHRRKLYALWLSLPEPEGYGTLCTQAEGITLLL